MTLQVRSISSRSEWRDFMRLPFNIYQGDGHWVAPLPSEVNRTLDTRKNPYFRSATMQPFVCYRSGEPAARVVVVISESYWRATGTKAAFFGFYEAVDDAEISARLFEVAEQYCRNRGATEMIGPFNPNHYSELGMLTENFDSDPVFFETYNPKYYPWLMEKIGFHEAARLHTRVNTDAGAFVRRKYPVERYGDKIGEFSLRPFNMRRKKSELERLRSINNDAFRNNLFFAHVSAEEYQYTARFLSFVTDPSMLLFVEHKGEPVGAIQCAYNVNKILKPLHGALRPWKYPGLLRRRKSIDEIVIFSLGIKQAYQHATPFRMLFEGMCKITQRFPTVYTTWMYEENTTAIRASQLLDLKPYKRFSIYKKHVQ